MELLDLEQMETLLGKASSVERMDVLNRHIVGKTRGKIPADTIFMRHDVDSQGWQAMLPMAEWEAERGYRSTYYYLPGTEYWGPEMSDHLRLVAEMGHEIGYHNNSLAITLAGHDAYGSEHEDPHEHLARTLEELREWSGEPVLGTAAHGDSACRVGTFSNFQVFTEGNAGSYVGQTYRTPGEIGFKPRPLRDFGLEYMGDWLPRPHYITDSGGSFEHYNDPTKYPFICNLKRASEDFPWKDEYLVVLQHPDHWKKPFRLLAQGRA